MMQSQCLIPDGVSINFLAPSIKRFRGLGHCVDVAGASTVDWALAVFSKAPRRTSELRLPPAAIQDHSPPTLTETPRSEAFEKLPITHGEGRTFRAAPIRSTVWG